MPTTEKYTPSINPFCTSCRALSFDLSELKRQVAELQAANAAMSDVVRTAASQTGPNTAAILGAIRSGGDVLGLAESLCGKRAMAATDRGLVKAMENFERTFIQNALIANKGVRVTTATQLGISRKNLWEKCKKYGIETAGVAEGAAT